MRIGNRLFIVLFVVVSLLPIAAQAQSVAWAVFGNAADTSSAIVVDDGLFVGLIIPDDVDSDSLRFLASRDGTNYYPIHDPSAAKSYYVIVDTTAATFVPLDADVFFGIRRLKIITDDVTSAANDTIEVVYKQEPRWWRF